MEKLTVNEMIHKVLNNNIDYNEYFELQEMAYENGLLFFAEEKAENIINVFLNDFTIKEIKKIFTVGLDKLPKIWNRYDKATEYDRYELSHCDEIGYIALPIP